MCDVMEISGTAKGMMRAFPDWKDKEKERWFGVGGLEIYR